VSSVVSSAKSAASSVASSAKSFFGFADGGIVTGPTQAIIGEGKEAEAVIPLSQLDTMLENQQGVEGGNTGNRDGAKAVEDMTKELKEIKRLLKDMDSDVTLQLDGKTIAKATRKAEQRYSHSTQITN
jgi:hypothetical protein